MREARGYVPPGTEQGADLGNSQFGTIKAPEFTARANAAVEAAQKKAELELNTGDNERKVKMGPEAFMSQEEADRQAQAEVVGGRRSTGLRAVPRVGASLETVNVQALKANIVAAERKAKGLAQSVAPEAPAHIDLAPTTKPLQKKTFLERLGFKRAA